MRVAIFALGFLTGQEMDRLPEAMRVLRDVLPEIEVTISSQYSPLLADALTKGKLDLAFMRAEPGMPDLTYQLVAEESLVAVLPSDHRLAAPSDGDRSRAAVTGWKQPVLVGEVGRVSDEERQEMRDVGLQQRVRPGPQRGLTNGLGGLLAVLSSRRSSDPPRRPKIQETFHGQDHGATPPASLSARRRQLQAPGPVLIAVDIARLDFAPA
jgi:DNA-binding transcriptional LysR family regulator